MTALIWLALAAAAVALVQWRLGLSAMRRRLAADARPLDDPELEALTRRLGRAAGVDGLRAQALDMPAVNGLATPDGGVFLTTGLLDRRRIGALSAAEVASVVAHEMGHLALGHHRRRLIDWTGANAARMALGAVLNRFLPVIGFLIADALTGLVQARLSRGDEFEADRYATALMLRAGLGWRPQATMLEKLGRMSPGPKGAAWLASHPPIAERVAAIEANAAAWTREDQPGA